MTLWLVSVFRGVEFPLFNSLAHTEKQVTLMKYELLHEFLGKVDECWETGMRSIGYEHMLKSLGVDVDKSQTGRAFIKANRGKLETEINKLKRDKLWGEVSESSGLESHFANIFS